VTQNPKPKTLNPKPHTIGIPISNLVGVGPIHFQN
jgi:hypothetical protein